MRKLTPFTGWALAILCCLGLTSLHGKTYPALLTSDDYSVVLSTVMCENNVTSGGTITGDEGGCDDPVFDPSNITSVTLPTGGSGTLEYLWIFTNDDPDGEFSVWEPIPNTNSASYNPPAITETTYFRRCARRSGCDDYVGESNYVTKEVRCCDNVIDGGSIVDNQSACGTSYDPNPLTNLNLPTGGTGELEYLWFKSTVGPPFLPDSPNWIEIPNSNSPTYDPTTIIQTTYYIRCARRQGCITYSGETNIIRVTLSPPPSINANVNNPSCQGDQDGSITLQIMGGTAPFSYNWTGGIGNISNPTGLREGTYLVTVTDINNCMATAEFSLNNPALLEVTASSSGSSCTGNGTGTVNAVATGGTGSYFYQWDDPNNSTTATVTDLMPGVYKVTVTDVKGCKTEAQATVNSTSSLNLTLTKNDLSCAEQNFGSATVEVTGGLAPYTYQWSGGNNLTTPSITELSIGTYTVTVTDANNCQGIGSVTINSPAALALTISKNDVDCNGNSGSATVTVSGGTAPYTYEWNDPSSQTTSTATNLASGTYIVTVRDMNGCTDKIEATIEGDEGFTLLVETTSVECGDTNTGTATAIVTPDGGSYAYVWSDTNGQTTSTATGLSPGMYTVTVVDNTNGCIKTAKGTIEGSDDLILSTEKEDVTCIEGNNGWATVTVMQGMPPYTYQWNDAANQISATAINLSAGTYTVVVTDANDCSAIAMVTINEGGDFDIVTTISDESCTDASDGSASVEASNGAAPYSYRWNDALAQTTATATNLSAGNYTVTIADANNCEKTVDVTIGQPAPIVVMVTTLDGNCNGGAGKATANVTGGTAPYTYQWNDANNQTTQSANDLVGGNYTVTVTDARGCQATGSGTVGQGGNFTASIIPNVTEICIGESVQFSASPTGSNYTYQWTTTGGTFDNPTAAAPTYSMMTPGTYTVNVLIRQDTGCEATATATITVRESPDVEIITTATDVCVGQSVNVSANAIGSNLSYQWIATGGTFSNANSRDAVYTNAVPGTYTLTVFVSNDVGCESTATTTVTIREQPSVEIITTTTDVCVGQSISVSANGTGNNLSYQWTATGGTFSNANSRDAVYTNTTPGTYTLTVRVSNSTGCEATASTTVTIRAQGEVAIIANSTNVCSGSTINLSTDATGNNLSYQWTATGGTFNNANSPSPVFTMMTSGTYTISVQVTNGTGCSATDQVAVTINENPVCSAEITSDYNGLDISRNGGIDGSARVNVSGGSGNYNIFWSTGATTASISNLDAGIYRVTVTDDNGCQCQSSVTLRDPAKIGDFVWNDLDQDGIQDVNEPGIANVVVTLTGVNINGMNITLTTTTDTNGMYMFDGLFPGTYKVTFTTPQDYDPTIVNAGNNDDLDSDANPNTGMTQTVAVDYGDYNNTLDAGFILNIVNVGDYVFNDRDRDGIQDADEEGIEGVVVYLIDKGPDQTYGTGDDQIVASTTTDFVGNYLFTNVDEGKYVIQFLEASLPSNFEFTLRNQGNDDTRDSDVDPVTGVTDMFMIMNGQADNLTLDAGVYRLCDNVRDGGEIAADEDVCGSGGDPSVITSVRDASGGAGTLEYLWLKSTTATTYQGINDPNWQIITGANGSTYDPPQIFVTTYFIRCARREGCSTYLETNIITKKIVNYTISDIEIKPTDVCRNETANYVAALGGFNPTYEWHFGANAIPQTATGRSVNVRWTSSGTKTISLNVVENGCANYTTHEIEVTNCIGLLGQFNTIEGAITPDEAVDLMWMTDADPFNSNFMIERANADGERFYSIDVMAAKGGAKVNTYHCIDKKPNIGLNYYRVKHFDSQGEYVYSRTVEIMVQPKGVKDIIVYPNPFRDRTTIQVVTELTENAQIQLVSPYGQVIQFIDLPIGMNYYDLDLRAYPKGVYYIYVTYNGHRKTIHRLLKVDDK